MSTRPLAVLLLSVCSLALVAAPKPPLPAAPSGFTWERMTDTNAHFLKPSKWHVSQESGFDGGTSVMHITKGAGGNGATGTAMYVSATPRIAANELAALVKDELEHAMMDGKATAKSHEVKGPFTIDSVRVDFREDDAKWTKQVLVIVNNRTRTLYSLSFESSATGWAEAWKLGEPMMRLYSLDEKY